MNIKKTGKGLTVIIFSNIILVYYMILYFLKGGV